MNKLVLTAADEKVVNTWAYRAKIQIWQDVLHIASDTEEIRQQMQQMGMIVDHRIPLCDVVQQICAAHQMQVDTDWRRVYDAIKQPLVQRIPKRSTDPLLRTIFERYNVAKPAEILMQQQYLEMIEREHADIELMYDAVDRLVQNIQQYDATELHPYGRTGYALAQTAEILAQRAYESVPVVLHALIEQYRLYAAATGTQIDFDYIGTCNLLMQKYAPAAADTPRTAANSPSESIPDIPQIPELDLDIEQIKLLHRLFEYCIKDPDAHVFASHYTDADQFIRDVRNGNLSKACTPNKNGNVPANFKYIVVTIYTRILDADADALYRAAVQSIGLATKKQCSTGNPSDTVHRVWSVISSNTEYEHWQTKLLPMKKKLAQNR